MTPPPPSSSGRYVSIGPKGSIVRLPHDGSIAVRGGRAPVYRDSGRREGERTLARCSECDSPYYFTGGDYFRSGRSGPKRCPACHRRREAARVRDYYHANAKYRKATRARTAKWQKEHRERKLRLQRKTNARYRARRKAARPERHCKRCGLPVPRHLNGRTLYCSRPCAHAAQRRQIADNSAAKQAAARAVRLAARTCRRCGASIALDVPPRRRYCTAACRRAAMLAKHRASNHRRAADARAARPQRACRQCGVDLPPGAHGKVFYCSLACRRRVAAENMRHRRRLAQGGTAP